jgi:hypothetical protein
MRFCSSPSKLASINQSRQANATLLSEIQKLDGHKRTDADSVTVTSFDQQYQTLNTATSALMANYEELVSAVAAQNPQL